MDPFRVIAASRREVPVVLVAEHAGDRLPPPWTWPEPDLRLVGTHWSTDVGVAAFTERLAATLDVPAVLSTFTRLLVDPNRPLGSETLFREVADHAPVHLNRGLTENAGGAFDAERARRIDGFWRPYHATVDRVIAAHPGADVLGLHSFTPDYQGERREVEIGVLYDRDVELGLAWAEALAGRGFDVRLNEPWSGLAGLMHSPQTHATRHLRRAVELEVRNDLLGDEKTLRTIVELVAGAVNALHRAG
jgi:predicted N-formylglutamate amidohydrolase